MMKLKMVQIQIAQFQTDDNPLTYSTLGLDDKGRVWRYDPRCGGWVAYKMEPVSSDVCDGHRR